MSSDNTLDNNSDNYVPRMVITKLTNSCTSIVDDKTTHCAICRNGILEPSVEYVQNPCDNNKNGLKLCKGCHTFHLDCISRWIKTSNKCPLCNTEWDSMNCRIETIQGYEHS